MTKRTKKNPASKAVLALFLVGVVGATALAVYVKWTPQASHVPTNMRRTEQASHRVVPPQEQQRTTHVDVVTPSISGTDLTLKHSTSAVPDGENPMVFAVNEFLKNSKIVEAKAKAIGVQVKDGVAYMDFTPAFRQSYGSFDERSLLQGICTTMGQFHDVQKVQFQVDGHPLDSIGNVELSDPIDVIRAGHPAGAQANSSSGFGG